MKIIVVEDNKDIASFIEIGLKESGYQVDSIDRGDYALSLLQTRDYDLAIIDIMLPELDGLSLVKKIREENKALPILFLSAKGSLEDKIKGLETGGDDYMVKPFSFAELKVRVDALIRRSSFSNPSLSVEYAGVLLDPLTREVTRDGNAIELQPKEFALLEYFIRNAEQVLTKTLILEKIWNYNFNPQTNVIDVLVARLRRSIDKDYEIKLIHTVRGVGYVFKLPVKK